MSVYCNFLTVNNSLTYVVILIKIISIREMNKSLNFKRIATIY